MTNKLYLFTLAAICAAFTSLGAECVAKFAPLEAGAKSLGYTVAAHSNNKGWRVTGPKSWPLSDGTTVIVKYSGLSASGDQAIVTLRQSNDDSYQSKVGLSSKDGVLKGIWQGGVWTANDITDHTLEASGTVVFVYGGSSGVVAYDVDGNEIYKEDGLKQYREDYTTGVQFDLGSTHGGAMNQTGFTIEAVEVLKGAVASSDVPTLIADFGKSEAAEAFRAEMGVSCSGWFADWSGENGGAAKQVVTANGVEEKRVVFNDSTGKWHPYRSASVFPVKNTYVMSVYGTADMVACPAENNYAVLWSFGETSRCNVLAKDHEGNIVFIHSEGNTVSKKLTAGPVSGYHLFTVVFDKDKGCGLYIDNNAGVYDSSFTALPIAGWQIGSVYRGIGGPYVRGIGFVPLNIWASEEAFVPMVDKLAKTYPAVTTLDRNLEINASGAQVYLPSLTIPEPRRVVVKEGRLIVPSGVSATVACLEFGDKQGGPSFGLDLDGELTIDNSSSFSSADVTKVYDACNAGRGVNFGEWTGAGTFNIRGTFNAPDQVVELVYDSSSTTFNINGGTFVVKGITAKNPDRATINLTNGGTISYGAFPSCAGVVKNYGYGTVTGTSSWTDTDAFTIVADENGPTTFAADAVALKFTGDLVVNGTYEKLEANGGSVALNVPVEEDVTITEPGDYISRLTGPSVVTVDVGEGNVVTFTQANTFTGGLTVKSGTARTTNATGFGPNNYGSVNTMAHIAVEAGATLDLANTKDTCYILHSAGTIVNTGSPIGDNSRQTTQLYLTGDTTVSGATFGLLSVNHGATLLDLGGHTLTVDLDSDDSQFHLSNTTVQNPGVIKMVRGRLWVNPSKAFSGSVTLDLADFTSGMPVVIGKAAAFANFAVAEGQSAWSLETIDNQLVAVCRLVAVDGKTYGSISSALEAIREGSVITLLEHGLGKEELEAVGGLTMTENGEGGYTVSLVKAEVAALRISEIMPKPVDKPVSAANPATLARLDPNGLESGWVELENTSANWVDLADYKFIRTNRSKANDKGDYDFFPSRMIPPKSRYVFWTSERYSNSASPADSAFVHGTFDGKPQYFADYDMMIWGDKVNPKKSPFVRLYYKDTIVDTVVIPTDLPEGHSIVVDPTVPGRATTRWMTNRPTRGTANTTTGLVALGPNAGPLYEIAGGKKHSSENEFARVAAPASPTNDYEVVFAMNPTMSPTVAASFRDEDAISNIVMVVRTDLNDTTLTNIVVDLATKTTDAKDWGDLYTATIPKEIFPAAGHLIQWKFKVTDASGNEWTTPSFHNKDDGYEWYGTIVEPGADLVSKTLPTWHMFTENEHHLAQMDVDADKQNLNLVPNNARIAIYDASTSNYYDYVRIDLRGNTSRNFNKKSHGLRFAKSHPLTMTDIVEGVPRKEVRKSSLIGEPADPSRMRQMMSFWLWNKMGNKVPFDFPVRCNLNGAFYQLGFHSERFTDELIEDFHKLDKYGYGYKNVGTLASGSGTTAGGIEKKTPDDGNETDISVLQDELRRPMRDKGVETGVENNAELTQFVVEKFDLAAWLNYLASARITQEMDDVWANISAYYDNAQMLEGARGTGTWMPLGYDFNLSLGQWYFNDVGGTRDGTIMADQDWFKSHPFYGGLCVRCYRKSDFTSPQEGWNRGIEAVLQNAKFRRLYLRRLRTLMDQELKAPGTPREEVPLMAKMAEIADLMREDAAIDCKTYPWSSSIGNIDVWGQSLFPKTMDAGIEEIWTKYIQPRQTHLYVTHSVTNTAKTVGYGSEYNAGIPLAQKPLEALKEGISVEAVNGGIVIRNTNAETIDLSGWDVSGPVVMKLPAGTIIDMMANGKTGEVFVVTDRRAYVTANAATLSDEVIVGNAAVGSGADIGLTAADGTVVISADVILPPGTYTDVSYDVPVRLAPAGAFELKGVKFNGGLAMGEGTFTLKNQNGYTNTASVVEAPTANIVFTGKGSFEMVGTANTTDPLMSVGGLYVSNGVFSVESKATTAGVKAVVVAGDFVVEDKGTASVKLSKKTVNGIAISQELKNKVCRIGKGGKFYATLNGVGGSAINSTKGTVNLGVEDGSTVVIDGAGSGVNGFKMDGKILVSGGSLNIVLPKGNAFSGKKGVDFTGTAKAFVIGSADALHGNVVNAADISGKTIKEWTAPEITGVETVKLFMMINGQEVTLEAEGPATWEEVEVTEATTVEELVGAEQGAKLVVLKVEPKKIVEWAKTHSSSTKPGAAIDLDAFALDCAPGEVNEKKKAFKVTIAFDPETGKPVVTKADGVSLNIKPIIEGSTDLINWHAKEDGDAFFKAVIPLGE